MEDLSTVLLPRDWAHVIAGREHTTDRTEPHSSRSWGSPERKRNGLLINQLIN